MKKKEPLQEAIDTIKYLPPDEQRNFLISGAVVISGKQKSVFISGSKLRKEIRKISRRKMK